MAEIAKPLARARELGSSRFYDVPKNQKKYKFLARRERTDALDEQVFTGAISCVYRVIAACQTRSFMLLLLWKQDSSLT